jgi:riboflavin synthase
VFTGLIEAVQPVRALRRTGPAARLAVDLGPLGEVALGASVAVNGACLTVAELDGTVAWFDVSSETLSRTTLGELAPGAPVNLERALRIGDRLGGHFVQGHVDGVAQVAQRGGRGGETTFRFAVPPELEYWLVPKGSVAVDGISLTVSALEPGFFEVWIIPETIARTNLRIRKPGDRVNIETDLIGKWVRRVMESRQQGASGGDAGGAGGVTLGKLEAEGYC